ncbi:MAG: ArsR/SmtB family transcription factor [Pyrinomonadaceae bacterium]
MVVEDEFVRISGLLCEPARARMLWNLLDGRAYTATELSVVGETSTTSASNHLSKLLDARILKVEKQGRHRYYSLANGEIAYVIESLANLAGGKLTDPRKNEQRSGGIKYCRTCYDHLAGFVGVRLALGLEERGFVEKSADGGYAVMEDGWELLSGLGIRQPDLVSGRRPLARQCLDWSERQPHIAGKLGAALLSRMLEKKWFETIQFSRELAITTAGRRSLNQLLGLNFL